GRLSGDQLAMVSWTAGDGPPIENIKSDIYATRMVILDPNALLWLPSQYSDIAIELPHDFYYVIPLALAECYHALGDYARAEAHYLEAAGYQYLNLAVEGPLLWQRLATLYLAWVS